MDELESLADGQTGVEVFFVDPFSVAVTFDRRGGFYVFLQLWFFLLWDFVKSVLSTSFFPGENSIFTVFKNMLDPDVGMGNVQSLYQK